MSATSERLCDSALDLESEPKTVVQEGSVIEKAIDSVRQQWIDALNQGSAEGFTGCLTTDAVWFPPRGEAVEGRKEIAEWLRPLFEEFRYEFTVTGVRLRVIDTWAVEEAGFRSVLHRRRSDDDPLTHQGRYLIVWHRISDRWLIDRYVDRTELR